jgi:hypothetical protein
LHAEVILIGLVSAVQHLDDIKKRENPGICGPASAEWMSRNGYTAFLFYPFDKCLSVHTLRNIFYRAKNEEITLGCCIFKPDDNTQPGYMRDVFQ